MLRSFFIYLSQATWARKFVTRLRIAQVAAARFVAGDTLEDAIRVVKSLNAKGINTTLDVLGEHTDNPEDARRATQKILDTIDAIDAAGVRSNVSVKLTQIGARISDELVIENLSRILERARSKNNFVRIDMEDSPFVDQTLELYRKMLDKGLTNTGVVIQAYLYRSEKDVCKIVEKGGRIRLCKGAYLEPAQVAFPKKSDVDANYDRLVQIMMDATKAHGAPELSDDGLIPPPPGLATHDEKRVEFGKQYATKIGLSKRAFEFQMLNGIRRDLQEQLAAEGYSVRVYVPYGTEWYPYFARRLAERPANVWFILANFFRK